MECSWYRYSARFFLGNDNEEYRWKFSKGSGYVVSTPPLGAVLLLVGNP